MRFKFKAKTPEGEYKEGIIDSSSKEAAVLHLQKNNLLPLKLEDINQENDLAKIFYKYYDKVGPRELMEFFKQLSILIEARVPLISSLTAIEEQTNNKFLSRVIQEMVNDVENGLSFSSAMEKHREVFPALSVNIIKVGESSGNLKKSIDYVADNIERNYNLSSKIKSALTYPGIVLTVFFIIGFLAVSFIIPKLTAIIKELNADVPWYTQVVINISDFMASFWWAVAIVILGILGGLMYYINSEDGKKDWDHLKIKLPAVGKMFQYVYMTRFAENLSVLLSGGIPIIRGLNVVSSVMNNVVYEAIILAAAEEVRIGGNMSSVFKKNPLIPPMVSHMIKIGEESGQIDSVLGHIANFYERETETMARNLSSILEPFLMVLIGICVGFMAFAILMPIYNIAGQIK